MSRRPMAPGSVIKAVTISALGLCAALAAAVGLLEWFLRQAPRLQP